MLEQFSVGYLTEMFPSFTFTVPYLGVVNMQLVLAAGLLFLLTSVFFWLLRAVVIKSTQKLAGQTKNRIDNLIVDSVSQIRVGVYVMVSFYISLQLFTLPNLLDKVVTGLFLVVVVWQLIEIATNFLSFFVTNYLEKDEDGDGVVDANSATTSYLVTMLARIVFWSLGILFILSNIGVEVTSLIAGLGVGGIAVAFALQGVLGDLFASFSLYFDRPFRIGDYIVIGDDSGTVEKIGIKSTRIRTLQGEELVVSNTELTATRVQNFKKMQERRIVMQFGITYETPQDKVKAVSGIVEGIFADLPAGRLNRVHFTTFGDSALMFEVVYYVDSADYTDYLNLQQDFNFSLLARFAEAGIDFAYPTQTIYTKTV